MTLLSRAQVPVRSASIACEFGYSGVFADPDGHTCEVAYIEAIVRRDDGAVDLPS